MEQKNISADDLILFATIAEQASLVRAAEQLGMPKPPFRVAWATWKNCWGRNC